MGTLFIFLFILILAISALLFFNKGTKAQEIKGILKDIYENLKALFSNLKKLFLILKELIQSKFDSDLSQKEVESIEITSNKSDPPKEGSTPQSAEAPPEVNEEPQNLSSEIDSTPQSAEAPPEVDEEPQNLSSDNFSPPASDSNNERTSDLKN